MSKIKARSGLIAALDIGTSKVCCFIARALDDGALRVIGIGHHVSRGMRNGVVVDMDQAETSIRAAVDDAEQMAGERIHNVVLNVSGGRPGSKSVAVDVSISGHEVSDSDVRRILDHGRAQHDAEDRDLLHCIPVGYRIDGNDGIRDPRGMFGDTLGVSVHLISAASSAVRNLNTVVARCHLDVEMRAAAPYASALACLVEDEKDLGVTCIDMGGGTTSISVFIGGQVVYVDSIPIGGAHVTSDIARGLSTPVAHAERLKTLYASARATPNDHREMLKVPLVGEDDDTSASQVPRSVLIQIVQPRLEETFELVRGHLEASGFDRMAGRRVVLTGGASQMENVRDLAAMILDKQVRMGRPHGLSGLAESTAGPAFSTAAGLLKYATFHQSEAPESTSRKDVAGKGRLGRIGTWLRENF